jgi:hypothetical protein
LAKRAIKEAERSIQEFLQQFNERDIRVVPNPESKEQNDLANELSDTITVYEFAVESHEYARKDTLKKFREKLDSPQGNAENIEIEDADDLGVQELTETTKARVQASLNLMHCINKVKAHGMVHDGEGLVKKLRQCQADNVKLAAQILEYKNKLGIKN